MVRVWSTDALGRRISKSKVNVPTPLAARKLCLEFEAALDNSNGANANLTFEQLQDMYMEARADKMSPETIYNTNCIIRVINLTIGKIKAADMTTPIVQALIDDLGKRPIKNRPDKRPTASTQQKYVTHIKAVLNWGVDREKITQNRVGNIELKAPTEFVPTILPGAMLGKILAYFKEHYYDVYIPVLIGATLGKRRGESCATMWSLTNLDAGIIDLQKTIVMVGGKAVEKNKFKTKSSKGIAVMSNFLIAELKEHKKLLGPQHSDYICASIFTGEPVRPDYVSDTFIRVMKKHFGIKMRLHDLRHSFNQLGYESNIDLTTRSKLLGHSKVETTNNVYTQKSIEKNKVAVNIITDSIERGFSKNCAKIVQIVQK